jgi:serine protease inhibitor
MRYVCGFVIRILTVIVFCSVVSCGSDSGANSQTPSQPSFVQSSLARDVNPQVSDPDLAAVVAGNAAFALKVFPLLDKTPDDNTVFSPYSITQAFALLAPGARGTTLSEIEQTLSFSLPQDRLNPAFNKLDLLLASRATGAVLASGLQTPSLRNANAVWGQQGFPILPAYLDTLAINYGAGIHLADFVNAAENSRQAINAWVEKQTNNRIQNLIPQNGVSSASRVVLTNAIWFKANWASQFWVSNTANRPFTNRDGSSSSIPFMSQTFLSAYARVDGCQAIDIPYAGLNLSMLLIMPDSGNFDTFLSALTPTLVGDITNHLTSRVINFSMPKFSFTGTAEMRQILITLGMTDAFDPARADLSGIDGNRDLFVGDVFHQAFVSVDEAGTEAAAATAITVAVSGIVSSNLTLTIDHPFIFLIRDRQTGLILFMGKVVSL